MKYSLDRENTRKPLEGYYANEGSRFSDRGFIDHSTSVGPTLQYDWAIDPHVPDDSDNDKTRISINRFVDLVRKLKCGKMSSKERKQRQLDFGMNHPIHRREGSTDEGWGFHQQNQTPIRYSRNVNITVERVDAPRPPGSRDYSRRQSSFSEYRAPIFHPVPGRIPDGRLENHYFSPIMIMDQQSPPKIGVDRMSAQKERWLKLIQQGWSEDHIEPVAVSSGAGGYSPARGSSRQCESANSNSGDTEYTTESDETEPSSTRHVHNVHNQSVRRKGSSNQRRQTNQGSKNDLWEGLAEDFGIFAGLLLSDGSACVGTISDITRETVADSCNSNDTPSQLETFYSMDVRDHSLLGRD